MQGHIGTVSVVAYKFYDIEGAALYCVDVCALYERISACEMCVCVMYI